MAVFFLILCKKIAQIGYIFAPKFETKSNSKYV